MRKSPATRRMVKMGRKARGMPPGRTGRMGAAAASVARTPQPKPAPDNAQGITVIGDVSQPNWSGEEIATPTEEQLDAAQERPYNDLYDKKVTDLRAMAKDAGIKGYSKMNKNDLVEALS